MGELDYFLYIRLKSIIEVEFVEFYMLIFSKAEKMSIVAREVLFLGQILR